MFSWYIWFLGLCHWLIHRRKQSPHCVAWRKQKVLCFVFSVFQQNQDRKILNENKCAYIRVNLYTHSWPNRILKCRQQKIFHSFWHSGLQQRIRCKVGLLSREWTPFLKTRSFNALEMSSACWHYCHGLNRTRTHGEWAFLPSWLKSFFCILLSKNRILFNRKNIFP